MIDGVFDHRAYSERALARLVKAKAKAERAAARSSLAPSASAASSTSNVLAPEEPAAPEETPAESSEPPPVSRTELMRANAEAVARFMRLVVPILVDAYAASVALSVRTKSLTALLKALSFMDADELKRTFKVHRLNCSILRH